MAKHGKIWWSELLTWDAEAAKRFYADILGWTFQPLNVPGHQTYWIAYNGDVPVAGIYQLVSPAFDGMPNGWLTSISVPDIDVALKRLTASGGRLIQGPFENEHMGKLAIVFDGGGAIVSLVEPAHDEVKF